MRAILLCAAVSLCAAACDCGDGAAPCTVSSECATGEQCLDGMCTPRSDGGGSDGGDATLPDSAPPDASGPPCAADGSCEGDARCVSGVCVAWGDGEYDDGCERVTDPGPVLPQIQCTFETAPMDDPRPDAIRALHTPLVANLGVNASPDVPARPSVVYIADYGYMEGVPRGCTAGGRAAHPRRRDLPIAGRLRRAAPELAGHAGDR